MTLTSRLGYILMLLVLEVMVVVLRREWELLNTVGVATIGFYRGYTFLPLCDRDFPRRWSGEVAKQRNLYSLSFIFPLFSWYFVLGSQRNKDNVGLMMKMCLSRSVLIEVSFFSFFFFFAADAIFHIWCGISCFRYEAGYSGKERKNITFVS